MHFKCFRKRDKCQIPLLMSHPVVVSQLSIDNSLHWTFSITEEFEGYSSENQTLLLPIFCWFVFGLFVCLTSALRIKGHLMFILFHLPDTVGAVGYFREFIHYYIFLSFIYLLLLIILQHFRRVWWLLCLSLLLIYSLFIFHHLG